MDETLRGVMEFHEAFGCHTSPHPEMPELSSSETYALGSIARCMEMVARSCHEQAENTKGTPANRAFLRLQLIQEELSEFARALEAEDIVAALDGLTDIQYVVDGSYLTLGLHELKLPAHQEVQRSNMTKLGDDGRPIINAAGRVVKGPNFSKPRLKELMYNFAYGGSLSRSDR